MQTANWFTMFYIQSCRALEGAAFALLHFAMWFLLYKALTWLPFLFDSVCSFIGFSSSIYWQKYLKKLLKVVQCKSSVSKKKQLLDIFFTAV